MADDDSDDDDDNDIRAGLRLLVDEGGPAASDAALREVMHRGRRQRRHNRLGAVAAVAAAVTGIGVAGVMVPTVIGSPGQLQPAPARQRPTTMPQKTPTSEDAKSEHRTTGAMSSPAEPPQLCPEYPNYESAEWFDRVPSIKVCPATAVQAELDFADVVRSALPRAAVELRYQAGGSSTLRVAGSDYAGTLNFNVRRYYGDPAPNLRPIRPDDPLVVKSGRPANGPRGAAEPAALIYTHSGELYIVRVIGPDPMPADQFSAVVRALAEAQG